MKQILIIIFLSLSIIISTGCNTNNKNIEKEKVPKEELKSGQMICTKTENVDGLNTDLKVTLDYKDNDITKIINETKINITEKEVPFYKEIYDGLKDIYKDVRGISITTNTGTNYVNSIFEIDYNTLDTDAVKKVLEKLGQSENDSEVIINKNNLNIDTYKKEYLDGYKCN